MRDVSEKNKKGRAAPSGADAYVVFDPLGDGLSRPGRRGTRKSVRNPLPGTDTASSCHGLLRAVVVWLRGHDAL